MTSLAHEGNFLLFMPITEGNRQYILYCGGGSVLASIPLSYCYEFVVCQCPDMEAALLLKQHMAVLKITNISPVIADVDNLPYCNSAFSLAIVNRLVLPNSLLRVPQLINRMNRIGIEFDVCIRRTGYFCVLTEFSGTKVQQAITKGCLLVSYFLKNKITNFFIDALFFHYESFARLYFVRRIDRNNIFTGNGLLFLLKRLAGGNNVSLVLKKGSRPEETTTIIDQLQSYIEGKKRYQLGELQCVRIGSGGSLVAEFTNGILRVPLEPEAQTSAERNFSALEFLQGKNMPFVTPKPVMREQINGLLVYCETKLIGTSLDLDRTFMQGQNEWFENKILQLLTDKALVLGRLATEQHLNCLVDEPFRLLEQFMSEPEKHLLEQVAFRIKKTLLQYNLPLLVTHGDFKKSNFIICSGQDVEKIGLIDWEGMQIPGLPFVDLLRFMSHELFNWYDDNDDIITKIWQLACAPVKFDLMRQYSQRLDVPLEAFSAIAMVYIVSHIVEYCCQRIAEDVSCRKKIISIDLQLVLRNFLQLEAR